MKALMEKKDVTEPLFLVLCCEELRVFGIFEKLTQKIKDIAPTYEILTHDVSHNRFSLQGLLDQILDRLEAEEGRDIVRHVLSLLQVSRHGLLDLEISEILRLSSSGNLLTLGSSHTSTAWASVYFAFGLLLRPMGREGQLDFFHRQIAKAVQRRYFKDPKGITSADAFPNPSKPRSSITLCSPITIWPRQTLREIYTSQ